jgi:hypothetical protein
MHALAVAVHGVPGTNCEVSSVGVVVGGVVGEGAGVAALAATGAVSGPRNVPSNPAPSAPASVAVRAGPTHRRVLILLCRPTEPSILLCYTII